LKGYSVMPRGILSMCKNGVFLITEKDGTVYSRSYWNYDFIITHIEYLDIIYNHI
jgi:hypothetical protein